MTTPTKSPTREWKLKEAVELLRQLLDDRNRRWEKSKFYLQSKLQSWKTVKRFFDAHSNRWGWPGLIKFLVKYEEDIQEIIPGETSKSQNIKHQVEDLLYGVKKYAEENPSILL